MSFEEACATMSFSGDWADEVEETRVPTRTPVSYSAVVLAGTDKKKQQAIEVEMRVVAEKKKADEERKKKEDEAERERLMELEKTRVQEEMKHNAEERIRIIAQMEECEAVTCPKCGNTKNPRFSMCQACFIREQKCSKCHMPKHPEALYCQACYEAERVCPKCGRQKSIHYKECRTCSHTCPNCGGMKSAKFPTCIHCSKRKH